MGKLLTKNIKGMADRLVEEFPDKFSKEFENNKASLDELKVSPSKTVRNLTAGYIVRKIKNIKD
ncbi:MAG: 30S ribosomal protein S17e [Candidatus Diapherotrites archaeon]|nr:30S ribosomal protein S17e [Candidatus Diapherotrites archaeon]